MDWMGWLKAEPTARAAVWSMEASPTAAEPTLISARPQGGDDRVQTARENAVNLVAGVRMHGGQIKMLRPHDPFLYEALSLLTSPDRTQLGQRGNF